MGFVVSEGTVVDAGSSSSPALLTPSRPIGISTYGGLTMAYEAIYRSQPNVRTVVSFLGRNIAQLKLKLYRRVGDVERRHERDHDGERVIRRPNPRTSRNAFFRALAEDLGIYDNFYALKVNAAPGKRALVRIPPAYVEPVGTNWLFPDGYRLLLLRDQPIYPYSSFVHLHGYNPDDNRIGLSPIETLRRILAEDISAGEYREQFWNRAARPSGHIERPVEAPPWSPEARATFREEWESLYAADGRYAGGTPVLEEGMTYSPDAFNAQESEYIAARKLTREEVASAYHVHPSNIGILDNANIGQSGQSHTALYQDTFAPLLNFIEEELDLQLLPDFAAGAELDELYYEFNLDEKLRGDFAAEAEAASRATGAPWLTRNEQRARRNLPPIDGADELIVPLNVTVGGRASPADTAPGTPGAGQASRLKRVGRVLVPIKAASDESDYPAELVAWQDQHAAALADFLEHQSASVLAKLGAGQPPAEALGLDDNGHAPRWDDPLSELYLGLALELAPVAGATVAERFDVDFDVERVTPMLSTNARIAAEEFNRVTAEAVTAAWSTPATASRTKADDLEEPEPTPLDRAGEVFALAIAVRALRNSVDRVTFVANFARSDAAAQGGATTKTWRTTSAHPRPAHATLNGVTVPSAGRFPNGGLWPGDTALSTDERAGCRCLVDFTEEEPTP